MINSTVVRRVGVIVGVLVVLAVSAVFIRLEGSNPPPGDTVESPSAVTGTTSGASDGRAGESSTTGADASGRSETSTTVAGPAAVLEVPEAPQPTPPAPAPHLDADFTGVGTVVVAEGGARMTIEPGTEPFVRVREGIVLAGLGQTANGRWTRVYTMCDVPAWIRTDQVAARPPADTGPVGSGFDFSDAVIVVDAGHGGPNLGGHSPDGLLEKYINVEIANRLRDLLSAGHSIDWGTGDILVGGDIPAAGRVILTRVGEGEEADYEAGLLYRAQVADTAGAHAMVSIHNNAGWELDLDVPGSDVYYQSQEPVTAESRRLATLLVEEFRRGFEDFDADWVGTTELGAKSRLSPRDGESQYYGILKNSGVPTVIAEGAYIANPSEAALLQTPAFQQAYAEAVYRALVRFVTTDDPGDAPSFDPEVWDGFAGSGGAKDDCTIPAQNGAAVPVP